MSLPTKIPYPTWLEINLSAVESNARYLTQSTGVKLMAVVKGNAYGHGSVEVGKAALTGGASWLAVARLNEARVLREAGITAPILILGMLPSFEVDEAVALNITLPMPHFEAAELYAQRAQALGKTIKVHLKVDTGLGRLGVIPQDVLPLAQRALELGGIEIDGLYSHYSKSGSKDDPLTRLQTERFKEALDSLNAAGIHPTWVHHSNSGATLSYPAARFNMVRAGSGIVGFNPFEYMGLPSGLRPALTGWKARLVSCKKLPEGWGIGYGATYTASGDEYTGIVAVGFGDGVRRLPGQEALIDGKRVPLIGSVSMDQITVKLPGKYPLDTEVALIGTQGKETITIDDCARKVGTVHVDISVLVAPRVPRVYYRD
jgi:alanine racemase